MAEYDPADGTVDQVNEYLDQHPDEIEAVMAAEQAGRARKGILEGPHAPQSDDEADPGTDDQVAPGEALEVAMEQGYDGDRYDETDLDAYTLQGVTTSDEAVKADASPHSPTADGPPTPVRDGSDGSQTDLREQDTVTDPPQED